MATKISKLYTPLVFLLWLFTTPAVSHAAETSVIADIPFPWGVDHLDRERIIVTSKIGGVYIVSLETNIVTTIKNTPKVRVHRQGGLLDIAVSNGKTGLYIYLCYSKPTAIGTAVAVHEARLINDELQDGRDIYISNMDSGSGVHFGCRLQIIENELFFTHGDRGQRQHAQDKTIDSGSIIRLVKTKKSEGAWSWKKEVFSIGHRNPQGLALNPWTGDLWAHEHGPRGGDEINVIQPNANFGWPVISYGEEYVGGSIGLNYSPEGFSDPIWKWIPSIAPSGMLFYTGEMFPELTKKVLVGSLKFGKIVAVNLNTKYLPTNESDWAIDLGRVRDLIELEDGSLIVLLDERRNGVVRIHKRY
ncbi:MAG: PQQ-dependent sugar dehydrogenase [Burkholderiales bacterium]